MIAGQDNPFELDVYTPAGRVLRMEVRSVVFPAMDGQMGVLAGHAPLVAMVGAGRLIVEPPEGKDRQFFLAGGFVHVRENAMTILAEECCAMEDLDHEAAWDELSKARRLPTETPEETALREQVVETARVRFRLAQEHRRKKIKGQAR